MFETIANTFHLINLLKSRIRGPYGLIFAELDELSNSAKINLKGIKRTYLSLKCHLVPGKFPTSVFNMIYQLACDQAN